MESVVFFFFFKQKTAYEIVSRDWSSDVCSSDLRTEVDIWVDCFRLTLLAPYLIARPYRLTFYLSMISYPYMGVTIGELLLSSLCELCVYIRSHVPCVYMHYVYTLNTHHVHQLGLYICAWNVTLTWADSKNIFSDKKKILTKVIILWHKNVRWNWLWP